MSLDRLKGEAECGDHIRLLKEVKHCDVKEGSAAKFSCCISGCPPPDVYWCKGEERIEESREFSMLVTCQNAAEREYILIITQCASTTAGSYTCNATNVKGSVKSSGNLSVEHMPADCDTEASGSPEEKDLSETIAFDIKKESAEKHYTLLEELGNGKFGTVYKCRKKDNAKEYAAKFIKCRSNERKAVINEIDIITSLNHKCIIKIIDAFEYSRQFVLVLELVSGGELFERLMEEELISETDVTFYIKQLLEALQHVHERNILHLDLKPENIMLVDKSSTQIKLIDFGLACRVNQGRPVKALCGTAGFVSPEVVGYDSVSPATDMWSVGVITYVLLSGFSPFEGDNDAETTENITRCRWDFDDPVFEEMSSDAKDFICKLLVKKQTKRASVQECLDHPWLKLIVSNKKIRTSKLVSFLAKRNWKKTISAVRTTNMLSKIRLSSESEKITE